MSSLLEVRGLDAGYGDFQALFGLDLSVAEHETVAVIGANGAGKTTFLRTVAGLVHATAGAVSFDGRDLLAVPAHWRVDLGIALVPEGRHLFPSLSVEENLLVGAHTRRPGLWTVDRVVDVFPLVGPLLRRPAGVLSGGEQQAVAIGRSLMANPRLLLLDEVSLGLAPVAVRGLYAALPAIMGEGTTVLVVEQDIGQALTVADRVVCLLEGRISLEGTPDRLERAQITAAYFGGGAVTWANAVVQGILLGGLFALFATGLSLAFGIMRFVNLAHGDLAVLAAFLSVSTTAALDINPFLSLVVIVPGFAAGGYLLQRHLFARTMGSDPLPSVLVTFGLGVVIQSALLEHYSADSRGLDAGAIETASVRLTDGISVGWFPLLTLVVAVSVLVALQLVFSRTRAGRSFRATADDAVVARLMGIDDRRVYASIMAIAFATVAVAGVFLGVRQTFGPADGPAALLFGFEAVVIGGLGSLWGTLLGGIVLGVAQTVGNQVDVQYDVLSGTLYGHLIFLAVLALRPQGLLGRRERV